MTVNEKQTQVTPGEALSLEFTYNSSNQKVRSLMIENQPWFVAKDVCDILGLLNPSSSVQQLDEDERAKENLGRQGDAWIINESGLYNLIFRSNKPEAKLFRKWVTAEVLPAIRANGGYKKPASGAFSPRMAEFLDARDQVYDTVEVNSHSVRHIIVDDADWYSLNDIQKAIGVAANSAQVVKKLNAKREMARRIFIFGNTHPSWFVRSTGLGLILAGSRALKARGLKLVLPVPVSPQLKKEASL